MRPRSKFFDDEEAIPWRRLTQKDIDEAWCIIVAEIEMEVLRKHDDPEDKWKEYIGRGNPPDWMMQVVKPRKKQPSGEQCWEKLAVSQRTLRWQHKLMSREECQKSA